MTTSDPLVALASYRARGSVSLYDRELERTILYSLQILEENVDRIGPTSLRHALNEQIIQMRATIWNFDQSKEST